METNQNLGTCSGACNCNSSQAFKLHPDILKFIEECKSKEHPESYLIAILHRVQEHYGYLSQESMEEVALILQVPTSVISGVSTFYHLFRLKPRGKYSVSVCMGTACFVNGAPMVLEAFKNQLGIELGDVTTDGLFSLDQARCIGVCAMAPVVVINERVFSNVKPEQVSEIISMVQAKAELKEEA